MFELDIQIKKEEKEKPKEDKPKLELPEKIVILAIGC